ncbi:MAG: endonuclease domain-containing protein [Alphaproteobacteria bacterium]|nr:endonuclease domain-containing protein [Alphaproteobacteria bacterium]
MATPKTSFAASSAKRLRTSMTDAERKLWFRIRNRQLLGFKFVRQLPIGRYVADFVCREAALIVEIDGGQHNGSERDIERTGFLNHEGYSVLRFWNNEVLGNTDGVLETIMTVLGGHPSPDLRYAKADLSPEGRGAKGTNAATARRRARLPQSTSVRADSRLTSPLRGEVDPKDRVRGEFPIGT